jgi:flagellar basal-body rod protein FlgF
MSANIDYVLLSHQSTADRQFAVLTGNLSLALLPGAQQNKLYFQQHIDTQSKNPLSFVAERGTYRNLVTGDVTYTGNSLDFAIIGQGYFKVLTPEGVRYGRNGRCHMGPNREVMIGIDGILLKDDDSPLIIPSDKSIADLQVSPDLAISIGDQYEGKLGVVRFENEQNMTYVKHRHLYETKDEALPPIDDEGKILVEVQQGSFEKSNVSSSSILFAYMQTQRNFIAIDDFMKKRHKSELDTVNAWLKVNA